MSNIKISKKQTDDLTKNKYLVVNQHTFDIRWQYNYITLISYLPSTVRNVIT